MGQNLSAVTMDHGCYKAYKFEYKWTIPNFDKLVTKNVVGSTTNSEDLILKVEDKNNIFHLILYCNGYNERVKDYLSIFLKKHSFDEMLIQFTCSVLDSNQKEINTKSIKQKMGIEPYLGWITYCRRDFLLDHENGILTKGDLTLNCTLEIFENKAIMNAETEEDLYMVALQSKMSKDMNQLLLDGEFSDIIVKVDGREFPAHKGILCARSAVFKTILKSQWQANSKEINISDVSAEAVEAMLRYIYSGDVGHIDVQMAEKLYYAAFKFVLQDLKNICSVVLKRNTDVNNAIDILLFGHKYSDNDLKYTTIEFIAKNAPEIQEKKEWMMLLKNYSDLANLVFKYLSKKP